MATTPTKNSLKGKRDMSLSKPTKPKQGQKTLAWPMKLWEVLWCLERASMLVSLRSWGAGGGEERGTMLPASGVCIQMPEGRGVEFHLGWEAAAGPGMLGAPVRRVRPRSQAVFTMAARDQCQSGTRLWKCLLWWRTSYPLPEHPQGSFRSIKSTPHPPPNTHP